MPVRLVLYEPVIRPYITEHALALVSRAAREVQVGARAEVPKRTGALAASIRTTIEPGDMSATATVGSDLPYALVVHEGSSPHLIRAAPGHVLHLGGGWFTPVVHHPGTRGHPYLMLPLEAVGRSLNFTVRRDYRAD